MNTVFKRLLKGIATVTLAVSVGGISIAQADPFVLDKSIVVKPNDSGTYTLGEFLSRGHRPSDIWDTDANGHNTIANYGTVDSGNINSDTLLMGGKTWTDKSFIKSTCQTYSQGDEGGTCYEFDNVGGPTFWHRNGSGGQDSINVGMASTQSAPFVEFGGNTIYRDSNGNITAIENRTTTTADANSGDTTLTLAGPVGCGDGDGKQQCDIKITDSSGNTVTSQTFTQADYDNVNNVTKITLPSGIGAALAKGSAVVWHVFADDGVAYGVEFTQNQALIYPKPPQSMVNILRSRMTAYTNYTTGEMSGGEHQVYATIDHGSVDHPNYYYGYISAWDNTSWSDHMTVSVESYQYPGTGQVRYSWRTDQLNDPIPYHDIPSDYTSDMTTSLAAKAGDTVITMSAGAMDQLANQRFAVTSSVSGVFASGTLGVFHIETVHNWTQITLSKPLAADLPSGSPVHLVGQAMDGSVNFAPGNGPKDAFDFTNTYVGSDGNTYHNTNTHQYPAPALFFGLAYKNFNMYWIQNYNSGLKDTISRDFDNEYDFWTGGTHPGETSSRGMTLVWTGGNTMATGSWMMRLAGTNLMPLGLEIDGVFPWGGQAIGTDSGFQVFRNSSNLPKLDQSRTMSGSMLGEVTGNNWEFGELAFYESLDNDTDSTYHLGIMRSQGTQLQYEHSADCDKVTAYSCHQAGQILFDINGGTNIGLAYGYGKNMKIGLVVDQNGGVTINGGSLTLSDKTNMLWIPDTTTVYFPEPSGSNIQMNVQSDNRLHFDDLHSGGYYFGGPVEAYGGLSSTYGDVHVGVSGGAKSIFLDGSGGALNFQTRSPDTNNLTVGIYYNWDYDLEGVLYFSNGHYGNTYLFNGDVRATGRIGWDGGTKGVNSNLQIGFNYDSGSQSMTVDSDNLRAPGLRFKGAAYANLPSITDTQSFHYCTDCYSKFREQGDTVTGLLVRWNGSKWVDTVGVEALH